jgi:hypothetical protein
VFVLPEQINIRSPWCIGLLVETRPAATELSQLQIAKPLHTSAVLDSALEPIHHPVLDSHSPTVAVKPPHKPIKLFDNYQYLWHIQILIPDWIG